MRNRLAMVLGPIFALTGFSALTLQVVWQRVISLHSGVDLASTTTVVAAFLAGLGFGSLLGGWLADRLGPRRSLILFALANVGIGVFAWISLLLFYDLYRELVPHLSSTFASFCFNTAILLVPTTLMGLSLPLVARAVTSSVSDAGPLIGRMYGVNTIGAGAGAAVAGWHLLGTYGFENTTRIAGTLNVVAALLIYLTYRAVEATPSTAGANQPVAAATTTVADDERKAGVSESGGQGERVWPWFAIYGLTGAVALGFEQLFFRVIDAEMRSNSYSFAHVLMLYLLLFGVGSAIGARLLQRGGDPRRWFLWMQFSVGITALLAIVVLVQVLPLSGYLDEQLRHYFAGEGYNGGFGTIDTFKEWAKVIGVYGAIPLGLMGAPVLLMGMSFPCVQALVSHRVDSLGRRTGALLFANIVGNVVGTLLTGFVLIDVFGTAGTYRLLTLALGIAGVAAAWLVAPPRRIIAVGAVIVVLAGVVGVSPSNHRLWAFMHGADNDEILLAEDHACAATVKFEEERAVLYINASIQNGHPFDDFHVLIGLVPALAHPQPEKALAIGLGIGSTTYGMLRDPRLREVETVELCGGEYDLIRDLADQGRTEFSLMLDDPRYIQGVGDGRKFLLERDDRYDIVTVDTLRSTSAFSGSLYSREFYELVASHLTDDGIVAQWIPTPRVANTAAQVFPYMLAFRVDDYNDGSVFFLGSHSPLVLDRAAMIKRLESAAAGSFSPEQLGRLQAFIATAPTFCYTNGTVLTGVPSDQENLDLRPRDEYFINNAAGTTLPNC
ncbi:MAG: fused MFS/spermidine synthase [Acidimicrobiales bacterium]